MATAGFKFVKARWCLSCTVQETRATREISRVSFPGFSMRKRNNRQKQQGKKPGNPFIWVPFGSIGTLFEAHSYFSFRRVHWCTTDTSYNIISLAPCREQYFVSQNFPKMQLHLQEDRSMLLVTICTGKVKTIDSLTIFKLSLRNILLLVPMIVKSLQWENL